MPGFLWLSEALVLLEFRAVFVDRVVRQVQKSVLYIGASGGLVTFTLYSSVAIRVSPSL